MFPVNPGRLTKGKASLCRTLVGKVLFQRRQILNRTARLLLHFSALKMGKGLHSLIVFPISDSPFLLIPVRSPPCWRSTGKWWAVYTRSSPRSSSCLKPPSLQSCRYARRHREFWFELLSWSATFFL